MGPAILARALGGRVPYAVKIHGSALEYTVKPHRERFLPYALEGDPRRRGRAVGSRHTAESLWELMAEDEPRLPDRTRLGPPGVDVHSFRPGAADLEGLARRLESAAAASGRGARRGRRPARARSGARPDRQLRGQADRLEGSGPALLRMAARGGARARRAPRHDRLRHLPRGARSLRGGARAARPRRAEGDRRARRASSRAGRRGASVPAGVPRHGGARRRAGARLLAAAPAGRAIHFTGRLEHDDLPALLPACEAQVMPSTFPEAFGMVAAEAAACGALPLSANHSGMAEVTATLAGPRPGAAAAAGLRRGPRRGRGDRLQARGVAHARPAAEASARRAGREAARRYSWESVAEGVIAAGGG